MQVLCILSPQKKCLVGDHWASVNEVIIVSNLDYIIYETYEIMYIPKSQEIWTGLMSYMIILINLAVILKPYIIETLFKCP